MGSCGNNYKMIVGVLALCLLVTGSVAGGEKPAEKFTNKAECTEWCSKHPNFNGQTIVYKNCVAYCAHRFGA